MKSKLIPSLIALAAAFTGNCLALTPIAESFTGNKIDETRWWQYKTGSGKLAQSGGKLNFVVPSAPTPNDFASMELLTSQPGYNESWQMILDLTNTANAGKNAGCGFMMFNVADRSDYLYVEFYGTSGIAAGVLVNGNHATAGKLSAKVPVTKGSIRVRFDATTKLMTFSVSLKDATEGYKWVKIGTFSPTGKGGDVRANWKINATGRFGIQLFGFGESKVIKAGKVTTDNFALTALP